MIVFCWVDSLPDWQRVVEINLSFTPRYLINLVREAGLFNIDDGWEVERDEEMPIMLDIETNDTLCSEGSNCIIKQFTTNKHVLLQ
jgi:hypothetical protein